MQTHSTLAEELDPLIMEFYQRALHTLTSAGVPFLVGGAYALAHYTEVIRHTKDFDIFMQEADVDRTLEVLAGAGYQVERTFPHWLAKVFSADGFIDVIHSSGNGVARVDREWIDNSESARILGLPVKVCPAEEMIWSKAFVMERERYDGADIAHLLRSRGARLSWERLLRRFGPHWRLFLSYLILFGFIYPAERSTIPDAVMRELVARLHDEPAPSDSGTKVCQGTLLSREQFLADIAKWGYCDARLAPEGPMSAEAITQWTAAIYS